jgi:RNA polymerase sigma-70 factor (ECF subfamily)
VSGKVTKHDGLPVGFVDPPDPAAERAEDEDTARLVALIQKGDRDAFSILYQRYFGRVFAYLRLLLNDVHEAEDATQDVFMQLMQKLPSYRPRGKPFRAWLFIVVRNHAIDRLRRSHRLELKESEEAWERALQRATTVDRPTIAAFDWIGDADLFLFVERLPLVQRQILALRFMLDMPLAEIAAVLGLSHANVRSLHHRALRYLNVRLNAVRNKPGNRTRATMRTYKKQAPVLRNRRWSLDP